FCSDDGQAAVNDNAATFLDMSSRETHYQWQCHFDVTYCLYHSLSNPVAAVDTGKDIDQHRFHALIRQYQSKCFFGALRRGAATDIQEIGWFTTCQLDHVHGCHGKP